jgi:hypothetical protein
VLGQLLCVVGVGVAAEDQGVVAKDELEVPQEAGQSVADLPLDPRQGFARRGVCLSLFVHSDASEGLNWSLVMMTSGVPGEDDAQPLAGSAWSEDNDIGLSCRRA